MISKELLSEVLNKEVIEINWIDGDNILWFNDYENSINIYELAHKCKEWLSEKYPNFSIKWANHKAIGTEDFQVRIWLNNECIGKADTEPEAIFKACEWILKENR